MHITLRKKNREKHIHIAKIKKQTDEKQPSKEIYQLLY